MKIISICAHPDDCEIKFGGTAAKLVTAGHDVKFVSMTCGDAGHHRLGAEELAAIRLAEAKEAARRVGAACEVLPHHDGQLLPTLEARYDVVRLIRTWEADIVLTHRPCDYHPDHRYTSQLVQDSAYMVVVPRVCPDVPPLRKNPVFMYMEDNFQLPNPFVADVAVDVTDVWEQKLHAMDAHRSQFYEWLPWVDGIEDQVPTDPAEREVWLGQVWAQGITPTTAAALQRRYGSAASAVKHAEAFQVCEYGRRPTVEELSEIFPR